MGGAMMAFLIYQRESSMKLIALLGEEIEKRHKRLPFL